MQKYILGFMTFYLFSFISKAQDIKLSQVPNTVKLECAKRFGNKIKISWEKENGNYEANWGGRSGEDTSVLFTPAAMYLQMTVAIPSSQLPSKIFEYSKTHYNTSSVKEAGIIMYADSSKGYEAEIKGKDLIFDEDGNFLKIDR